MSVSIFGDKAFIPDDQLTEAVLGEMKIQWDEVRHFVAEGVQLTEEWKFYGKQSGWTLLLKRGKRTVCYLFPDRGFFKIGFVFGEKAVSATLESALPPDILTTVREAKPNVEGRSFFVELRKPSDLENAITLIAIKVNH